MIQDIDAVAFDIDGTLYPDWSFRVRLGPFLAAHAGFLIRFGEARRTIRRWQRENPGVAHDDFFAWQASVLAPLLWRAEPDARALVDRLVYGEWNAIFKRVRPYAGVREAFQAFRQSGLKLGLLSDFLPSQKGDVWGLAPLCDAVLGSEETGALKPSPIPFLALARALGVEPTRILYVGNSPSSDVAGAKAVGMKTACIVGPLSALFGRTVPGADISFASYRQLTRIVLK
jgi:putative hydrolase of the HAD superfamily